MRTSSVPSSDLLQRLRGHELPVMMAMVAMVLVLVLILVLLLLPARQPLHLLAVSLAQALLLRRRSLLNAKLV